MSYEILKTRRDGFTIDSDKVPCGNTLADAIRNSGIRCETCENWIRYSRPMPDEGSGHCQLPVTDGGDYEYSYDLGMDVPQPVSNPDFFCAHHSALNNED